MFLNRAYYLISFFALIIQSACQPVEPVIGQGEFPMEVEVRIVPLEGIITNPRSEISGLAWIGNNLVLLPQYPGQYESDLDGHLFTLSKSDILAYLEGDKEVGITPSTIALAAPNLDAIVPGFEGFEALAINGDQVFLTIESKPGHSMQGYVIQGVVSPDLSTIHLTLDSLAPVDPQAAIDNFSDEAIIAYDDVVITFYETWGVNVNPSPVGHVFDMMLTPTGEMVLPNVEYRITDVTQPDGEGRFWAINYLYPGDKTKLIPGDDELVLKFGEGETHAGSDVVERLVEFQIFEDQIMRTETPPIQLVLAGDGQARNWEGIVRLDGLGFLLVTDEYPGTILGFIPID